MMAGLGTYGARIMLAFSRFWRMKTHTTNAALSSLERNAPLFLRDHRFERDRTLITNIIA